MDQVYVIRHKVLVEGRSRRSVAEEMGVSRNTVKRYVEGAEPGVRKPADRRRPVLESVQGRMDALLSESASFTRGKQRLTATRLHALLVEEGYEVGVTLVKEYVAEWRRRRREVFVPLVYAPGELAQVDFFEVWVRSLGVEVKAWMFLMRLMFSKRDFAWLYPRQDQVCFLDGHVRAFEHLGGVPQRIAYDNLKPAVTKILTGSERQLNERFMALSSRYLFEPSFCRPRTGHDKGGVEARGKGIRWQHLVPIPEGGHLVEMSEKLLSRLDARADDGRFSEERVHMRELPAVPFDAAKTLFPELSRRSLAKVEGAVYSAPSSWAGLQVTAKVRPYSVELIGPDGRVEHGRKAFGERSVLYEHYLAELAHKPQAVRQVADELVAQLGEPFGAMWRRLREEQGAKDGARVLARTLKSVLDEGKGAVAERVDAALRQNAPLLLALLPSPEPRPVLLDEHVPAQVRHIEVESASASDFDVLLEVTP